MRGRSSTIAHQRPPVRLPRAGALAVVVLSLAAAAHLAAGGQLPALPVLAALAAVVGLSAALLAGHKMTAPVLAVYLTGSQLTLHLAFSILSTGAAAPAGPSHHALPVPAGTPLTGEYAAPHQHLLADAGASMTAAHVGATLAAAVLLARGEAALWMLGAWLGFLGRPLVPGTIPPRFRTPAGTACPAVPDANIPARILARGPPCGVRRP